MTAVALGGKKRAEYVLALDILWNTSLQIDHLAWLLPPEMEKTTSKVQ